MNIREGTRRLGVLLGLIGAIVGGCGSYEQLGRLLNQRTEHRKFEKLAGSEVVQRERRNMRATSGSKTATAPPSNNQPQVAENSSVPTGSKLVHPESGHGPWEKYAVKDDPWKKYEIRNEGKDVNNDTSNLPNTLPADFDGWDSEVNEGGIRSIIWGENFSVAKIETITGQTLYPIPSPSAWSYLFLAVLPVLGFCLPWGVIRAIGWVVAGFSQTS